ncbi:Monothiol glutaredoxin-7 [Sparassis crispa]|uniref:Monothiol glutaredoxin-7 n=1 Tax=Sparassis crispa TaxID=139825 RepID=A0A401GEM3_9APHY|nr:Monothiol glutaredoxin-7 [Sparassis crispa]GBE80617.1 Monothiol glutaredoxin-7 [Sparassis crispa]
MSSPYRRRRIVWAAILLTGAFLFYLALAKSKDAAESVPEIHALLHFVTEHPDQRLNGSALDPAEKVDVRVFAPGGDMDWEKHLRVLRDEAPLVVFSKTFCPFSQRAKALLGSYLISPPPTVIELNLREDGPVIQGLLHRLTGRRTVPNILLMGESIGGADDIQQLHDENKLKVLLEERGLVVNGLD